MLDIAGWVKVGSAVATVISKLHNTDTVFQPAPLTKVVAGVLGKPTGGRAIAERVRSRLQPWLDTLPEDWILTGDIEAALNAVVATLTDSETLPRLAVKIYARREEMEDRLREVGKPRRDGLLGERPQLLFDRVLSSSVAVIAEMAPQSNTFAVEAATILLQELSELAGKLDDVLGTTNANHAEAMTVLESVRDQVTELTNAKAHYLMLRNAPKDNPDAIVAAVSDPRLHPYMARVGRDRDRALELYEWNLEMSAALYAGLAIVEVALRNAMDPHIGRFNANQPEVIESEQGQADWLLNPARLLVKLTTPPSRPRSCATRGCPLRSSIYVAQDRAWQTVGQHRKPSHNDVLAQTTFGMWGHLLPSSTAKPAGKGRARLWVTYVENAFPYLENDPTQLTLHVSALRSLRNRVAHLEPVLDRHQLRGHLDSMQLVLGAISPSLERWLPADRIDRYIGLRPHLDPRPEPPVRPSTAPR